MAFDPDEYLAEKDKQAEQSKFDPDAYLASPPVQFDPNAYIAETAPAPGGVNLTPQAVSVARAVAPELAPLATGAVKTAASIPQDWLNISKILYNNATLEHVGQAIKEPWKTATNAVGAYVEGHPVLGQITSATPKQAVGAIASGARNLGGALVSGAVAPESAFLLPYQMAAYEQEKIRANPGAPEYATNPYAQTYRGEYATQAQAGAANARRAVINAPYGNVTAEERALLDAEKKRKMQILMQEETSQKIRDFAASKVLGNVSGPVRPGAY